MNHQEENIKLGISIGDMNGIGSEIILKTFEDNRMLELCTPIIFANSKPFSFVKKILGNHAAIHGIDHLDQAIKGKINVLNLWKETVNVSFGTNDPLIGKYAIRSFTEATAALKADLIDVLVTAPINKYNIQDDDFKHPGHTDYLNQELEGDAMMLMVSDSLRIGLLTDHLPLKDVAKEITAELITRKVKTLNKCLKEDFNILKPRIALLGLNPHSGDNGVIGQEELKTINPTVKKLFAEGILITGPFAADSFFGSNQYEKFDAILACYHDQGLTPFKTLSFGTGVNYTAGLNKIRTSPDHGTAYEIAGKGLADPSSFREAIYLAIDVFKNRKINAELIKEPLVTRQKDFTSKKY